MKRTGGLTLCCLVAAGMVYGCGANDPIPAGTTTAKEHQSSAGESEKPRGTIKTEGAAAHHSLAGPGDVTRDDSADGSQAGQHRFALLVGCTTYYHRDELPLLGNLEGPANDVLLMRRLLIERYHFPKSHITILSEAQGGKNTPTRKHIQREFRRLAQKAKRAGPKGQFVVLLCGHGSWQPDNNGDEVDGRDETFLPADIERWNEDTHTFTNAIIDDELQKWTGAITAHGTPLWVIVDSCHSGTVLRGGDEDEVSRRVNPRDLGVPAEVLAAAKKQAASRRATRGDSSAEQTVFNLSSDVPALVAVYAATPKQLAWETRASINGVRKSFGLLTYTLCQVLNTARTPLTYRELVARINRQFMHRLHGHKQTSLVEGRYQDRLVLGSAERPPAFTLQPDYPKGWQIDGGRLHSLSPGSILAVYPPPGDPHADKPVGHVKITRTDLYTSHVEPTTYKTSAKPKQGVLKQGGRCEPVFIDYGSLQTTIAIDRHIMDRQGSHPPDGKQKRQLDRLATEVTRLAKRPGAVFRIAGSFAEAQWVIQFRDGRPILVSVDAAPIVGPLPDGTAFPLFEKGSLPAQGIAPKLEKLEKTLHSIARAQNLIALATSSADEVARGAQVRSAANVEVILLKQHGKADQQGRPLHGDNIKLKNGEGIAWRVTNKSSKAVDVTLLFIDSRFGIQPLCPRPGLVTDNRLMPGKSLRIPFPGGGRLKDGFIHVSAKKTTGREQLVAIAVKANGPASDFSVLAQPTLDPTRGGPSPLETPLGRLLRRACYGSRTRGGSGTRGQDADVVKSYQMHLLSWRVLPVKANPRKK